MWSQIRICVGSTDPIFFVCLAPEFIYYYGIYNNKKYYGSEISMLQGCLGCLGFIGVFVVILMLAGYMLFSAKFLLTFFIVALLLFIAICALMAKRN